MATNHCRCRSTRNLIAFLLITAVPLAIIIALDRRATTNPSNFTYHSLGWLRECAKWDPTNRRFLVSTFFGGGISEIVPSNSNPLQEREVVFEPDVKGNVSLGIFVDVPRGRLIVTYGDMVGQRYAAVASYDLQTWERRFLTHLSGQGDEPSCADDVTVDAGGNSYITDMKANKIWKVNPEGHLISIIRTPTFKQKDQWYHNLIGLNGIVYHPDGYLLVIHTSSGCLFKVNLPDEEVSLVRIGDSGDGCSLFQGDGLELISATELVVAAVMPSARVVESKDGWSTGRVNKRSWGPVHRVATSATVVDGGRVFLNHLVGAGAGSERRHHVITEAVFSPV